MPGEGLADSRSHHTDINDSDFLQEFWHGYDIVKKVNVLKRHRALIFDLSPIAESAKGLTLEIYRLRGYLVFRISNKEKIRTFIISLLFIPPIEDEFPSEFEAMFRDILNHFRVDVDGFVFEWLLNTIEVEFRREMEYLLGEEWVRKVDEFYRRLTEEQLKKIEESKKKKEEKKREDGDRNGN